MSHQKSFFTISKQIALMISILIILGFYLWQFPRSGSINQFGLNFFTGMIGTLVTVFIIDRLIQKRENIKRIPLKLAAYREVTQYVNQYMSFWIETYIFTVSENVPKNIEEFFNEKVFEKIFNEINLSEKLPRVNNFATIADWIVRHATESISIGNKILDRYASDLEPNCFEKIHVLTESAFHLVLCQIPNLIALNVDNPAIMQSINSINKRDELNAIIELQKWCVENYRILQIYKKDLQLPPLYDPSRSRRWIVEGKYS